MSYGANGHRQPHGQNILHMHPLSNDTEYSVMDNGTNEADYSSLEDLYNIEWTPKEFYLKFRQQVEGYQLGVNFEFNGMQVNGCNTKLVFKPLASDRKWKLICEPKQADFRLLTKKIPIGPYLNLQVGIGHEFRNQTTGWKWKLTSSFGANGLSQIRHKTFLPVFPGFDMRVGWNAEYVLPDIHGALGTGEPMIGMNLGHFYASIERVEAIFTHVS